MAGKPSNLEKAVRAQAESLDPAQKEFVLAELKTYLWNKRKINHIQGLVDSGELTLDKEKRHLAERHQLVSENSALFSHIMRWLKDTGAQESALDKFLDG